MSPSETGRRIVLNQRLVKDRDLARARELRRVAALCAALLVPVLFYVWQQVEFIRTGYRIEQLRNEKDRLTEWNRKLKVERATLLDLRRIERVANDQLGLVPPTPGNTVKIRLTGETAPSGSLASRAPSPPGDGLVAAER